jgi:hypothetical protein
MTLEGMFNQFLSGVFFGGGFVLVAWGLKHLGVVVF